MLEKSPFSFNSKRLLGLLHAPLRYFLRYTLFLQSLVF